MTKNKLIIANISGFYGDRLSAAQEMLEGGPVDFLTGDYLAELTMAILYKDKMKRPEAGYARSFLKQMEGVMGTCLDRNVKVVVNAGGLNPSGLAKALQEVADTLQIHPKIAYIEGDDLMPRLGDLSSELRHLDNGKTLAESGMFPVSANAYLGCWGIVDALNLGANIIVTGRVADTSLVMGPAAHHFGWNRDDWDDLAGAATAGHIIECSGQAAGGNYSYFEEVPTYRNLGFPIAEIFEDGSSIITKHEGTGGLVSVGTVTAQLMYEVNAPAYITPDVVAHFDTIKLEQTAKDRVRVSGVKGSPATKSAKVTVNCMGGFQNSMTFLIAGLDNARKAEILQAHLSEIYADTFEKLDFQYFATDKENPMRNEEAFAQFKISVADMDMKKVGKGFTSKLVELALCMVPGVCWQHPPMPAKPRIVHFPALLDKKHLEQSVYVNDAVIKCKEVIPANGALEIAKNLAQHDFSFDKEARTNTYLGRVYAARSGDKGGNANLGIWGRTPKSYAFLRGFLSVEKLKELLPDTAPFEIIRYEFPNLLGLNFYLIGFLGDGIAASIKVDGQAKTLGEYLRAKRVDLPASLLNEKSKVN